MEDIIHEDQIIAYRSAGHILDALDKSKKIELIKYEKERYMPFLGLYLYRKKQK